MFKLILVFKIAFTPGLSAVPVPTDGSGSYSSWANCQAAADYTIKQSGDNMYVYYVCVPTDYGLRKGLE